VTDIFAQEKVLKRTFQLSQFFNVDYVGYCRRHTCTIWL